MLTGDTAVIFAFFIVTMLGLIIGGMGISVIWTHLKENKEKVRKILRDLMVGVIAGVVGAWILSTKMGTDTSLAGTIEGLPVFILNLGFFILLCGLSVIALWNIYPNEDNKSSLRNLKCKCFYSRRRSRY